MIFSFALTCGYALLVRFDSIGAEYGRSAFDAQTIPLEKQSMMGESVDFEAVVPIIPAGPDMSAALAFYVGKLGFATISPGEDTVVIQRGAVQLILQKSDDTYWASQTAIRIRVRDLEATYTEMRDAGVGNACKMTGIMNQPWGTREFHVVEPFGVCLHFYVPTRSRVSASTAE